jgi:MFS family permease
MGFLGILEDNHLAHVPGTVILNEESAHSETVTAVLKHGTGKDANIILAPQPSDDPNDPLNWSTTKKLIIMLIISFGTIIYASTFGPLLNAGLFTISADLGVPLSELTLISGYMLLVAGASGPVVSACSRKWGKRPCFIASSLFALIGTIVGSCATNVKMLMAARIIQGLSTSAYESLVVTIVGDLYFVHQRGVWTSGMQFLLGAISNFSSVIAGVITTKLGWKYLFHILNACIGAQIILLFFFCPETTYNRERRFQTDVVGLDNVVEGAGNMSEKPSATNIEAATPSSSSMTSSGAIIPAKKTFWEETAIFTGTHSEDNLLQLIIAPFAICTNLACLWVIVSSGTLFAFTVAQSFILAQVFSVPPYNLSASGVGYLSLGPFIGGLICALICSYTLDPVIRWASSRNHGIYEPEYRLLGMAGAVCLGAGLVLFGQLCQTGASMYLTSFAHGFGVFGLIFSVITSSAYALDAYRDMSNEIFIMGMVVKNFEFYGFSYFINDWTARAGPAAVFNVLGGVAFGIVATTPILFIFGKQYRSWWHRANWLQKWGVRTHSEI